MKSHRGLTADQRRVVEWQFIAFLPSLISMKKMPLTRDRHELIIKAACYLVRLVICTQTDKFMTWQSLSHGKNATLLTHSLRLSPYDDMTQRFDVQLMCIFSWWRSFCQTKTDQLSLMKNVYHLLRVVNFVSAPNSLFSYANNKRAYIKIYNTAY